MSKIYKTFEEWYMTQDMSRGFFLTDIWEARQPEIDQLKSKITELESQLKQSQKKSDAFLAGRRCGKTNLVEKLITYPIALDETDKTKCPVCDKTINDSGLFCSPECQDLHFKVDRL